MSILHVNEVHPLVGHTMKLEDVEVEFAVLSQLDNKATYVDVSTKYPNLLAPKLGQVCTLTTVRDEDGMPTSVIDAILKGVGECKL